MKFKLKELLDERKVMGHLFLTCISNEIAQDVLQPLQGKTGYEREQATIDMCLTINGKEVNLRHFIETLNEQYFEQVKHHAAHLVKQRTSDKLNELASKLQEMGEITENWALTVNWGENNHFNKDSNE